VCNILALHECGLTLAVRVSFSVAVLSVGAANVPACLLLFSPNIVFPPPSPSLSPPPFRAGKATGAGGARGVGAGVGCWEGSGVG
jgi:hypothetical protein